MDGFQIDGTDLLRKIDVLTDALDGRTSLAEATRNRDEALRINGYAEALRDVVAILEGYAD